MNTVKQKAGIATLQKHGIGHYSTIGKQGGRPRLKTLNELLLPADPGVVVKKGGIRTPSDRTGVGVL